MQVFRVDAAGRAPMVSPGSLLARSTRFACMAGSGCGIPISTADDQIEATAKLARTLDDSPSKTIAREVLRKVRQQLGMWLAWTRRRRARTPIRRCSSPLVAQAVRVDSTADQLTECEHRRSGLARIRFEIARCDAATRRARKHRRA